MSKNKFPWLWIAIITAIFLVISLAGVYFLSKQSRADMSVRLQRNLEILLTAVDPESMASIATTLSDTSDDFNNLRRQFLALEEIFASDGIDSIYSMSKDNGKILFLIDSSPLDSPEYGPPGDPYLNPPAELFSVFSSGQAAFAGPYSDEYGEFYSYFKPLKNHSDDSIVGVLGIDIQTSHHLQQLKKQAAYFIVVLLAIYLLAISLLIYIRKFFYSRKESQTQKRMIEDMINVLPDIFFLVGRDGKFILWNKSFLRIFGLDAKKAAATSFIDLFAAEDKKRIADGIERIYKRGSDSLEAEIKDKEGKKILFELSGAVLKDSEGEAIGFAGAGHDISLRHQREKDLAEQRDKLAKINRLMVGREMKMIDMKKNLADLQKNLNNKTEE